MHQSCLQIRDFALNFAGRVDGDQKCVALCCEPIDDVPAVALGVTGEETIAAFRTMRERVLLECLSPNEERLFTGGCLKCANFRMGEWEDKYLIGYVNLSMYPSPCQSKCLYCGVGMEAPGDRAAEGYEKVFDALEYALGVGLIAPKAFWQVSCGEITIHPYRDRILDIVQDRAAAFYTNCFRFDFQIAANLATNPMSSINLSIDSGTRDTWRRVKGVDNFGSVVENLAKYRESSARAGQITLKYIVLPGVNDGQADYEAVVGLMKALGTNHLTLARDARTKYNDCGEEQDRLVASAGRLVALLRTSGLTCDMFTFSPAEKEKAARFAARVVMGAANR